jgi:tetratricopeptide (TPR) repeat protein
MKVIRLLTALTVSAMAIQGGLAVAQTGQEQLPQGNRASEERRYVDAEATYRKAIAYDPKDATAYFGLGNMLRNQKKNVEAEAAYRKAIALDPNYADAYNNLSNVLRNLNKNVEAEAAYRKAIDLKKRFSEDEAAYRKEFARSPKDVYAYVRLGNALRNLKKYAEAESAFRQAIALNPTYSPAYSGLGNLLRKQKKYVEAEAAYRQSITLNPYGSRQATTYNNLGYILQLLGRLTEARDMYRMSIRLNPSPNSALANLEEVERLIGIASGRLKVLKPEESTRFLNSEDPLTPVRRSVVRILPTFSGKNSGTGFHGTGFVLRRQGAKAWILTARHVIRDPDDFSEATTIQVELYGGNLPASTVASRLPAQEVRSGDRDLDLALLEVVALPLDIQPLKFASGEGIGIGATLTMVGHPGSDNWKKVTGKLTDSSTNSLIVNSPTMAEGGSGSPMLSDKQRVVGMAYTINEPAQGIKQLVGYSLGTIQDTLSKWGEQSR